MSRYRSKDLFGSGPHQFHVGGLSERHEVHELPGSDGARVTALGRGLRKIEQTGFLLADDHAGIGKQIEAIEQMVDGVTGDLVDDTGRTHVAVMLVAFKPQPAHRLGARWAVEYNAEYLQLQPGG